MLKKRIPRIFSILSGFEMSMSSVFRMEYVVASAFNAKSMFRAGAPKISSGMLLPY